MANRKMLDTFFRTEDYCVYSGVVQFRKFAVMSDKKLYITASNLKLSIEDISKELKIFLNYICQLLTEHLFLTIRKCNTNFWQTNKLALN